MNNIQRLASSIRDYVNTYNLYKCYKANPDKWNMLCVSMDTLGDTCEALLNFESEGIEGNFGEKYLRLYGILQGVFLQQDAIKYLCKSLGQTFPQKLEQGSSNWKTIRNLRNLTVGHPVEVKINKTVKRCFITRVSITS